VNTSEAHHAIDTILEDYAATEVLLVVVRRAWTGLTFDDRREVGTRWPALADALLRVEGR
jgi:hypothetical protein